MTLEIRNTFFHYNRGDNNENDIKCSQRSRSTPPGARLAVSVSVTDLSTGLCDPFFCKRASDDGIPQGAQCSTQASDDACSHTERERMTQVSDDTWMTELFYTTENEADANTDSGGETDIGDEDDWLGIGAAPSYSPNAATVDDTNGPGTPPVVKFENVSQKVVDIWASLTSLEAQFKHTCTSSPAAAVEKGRQVESALAKTPTQTRPLASGNTTTVAKDSIQTLRLAPFLGAEPHLSRRTPKPIRSKTVLDTKAPLFKPAAPPSEVDSVLIATREILVANFCVAAVAVSPSASGNGASMVIQVAKPWRSITGSRSVTAIAKAALMQATAASRSVYVLGYEADPFEDDSYGSGFSTALAMVPDSWQSSACWETYQTCHCPRGDKCRWKHPGPGQIRPVRVIIA